MTADFDLKECYSGHRGPQRNRGNRGAAKATVPNNLITQNLTTVPVPETLDCITGLPLYMMLPLPEISALR